jgi:hypothetical protein
MPHIPQAALDVARGEAQLQQADVAASAADAARGMAALRASVDDLHAAHAAHVAELERHGRSNQVCDVVNHRAEVANATHAV